MSLGDTWMSCRQNTHKSRPISLLPEFNVPPGVTDFALETRPPHLPPRNSPSKLVSTLFVSGMCIFGAYCAVTWMAGPVLRHGSTLANGMSDVVGNAIARANDMAERRKQDHYEAKQEYLRRRGLAFQTKPDMENTAASYRPTAGKSGKSSLLLRMAALRKVESPVSGIDDDAVEQYFPEWILQKRNSGEWNQDAVLRDLVLAVSQLSHKASVDVTGDT